MSEQQRTATQDTPCQAIVKRYEPFERHDICRELAGHPVHDPTTYWGGHYFSAERKMPWSSGSEARMALRYEVPPATPELRAAIDRLSDPRENGSEVTR